MRIQGRVATWLEMVAAATRQQDQTPKVRLHPVAGSDQPTRPEQQCYAVSVDGRWLCSNNGRLTVLRGELAVDRFMSLLRNIPYETGEPAEFVIDCSTSAHCIAIGRDKSLCSCQRAPQELRV